MALLVKKTVNYCYLFIFLVQTMPTEKLTRLIQTLRDIINQQMEAADNSTEMPIESVAPWIILYYIIKR